MMKCDDKPVTKGTSDQEIKSNKVSDDRDDKDKSEEKLSDDQVKLQEGELTVIGGDIVALYPSLNPDVTPEAVRLEVIESEIEYVGVNLFEAGKYIL